MAERSPEEPTITETEREMKPEIEELLNTVRETYRRQIMVPLKNGAFPESTGATRRENVSVDRRQMAIPGPNGRFPLGRRENNFTE